MKRRMLLEIAETDFSVDPRDVLPTGSNRPWDGGGILNGVLTGDRRFEFDPPSGSDEGFNVISFYPAPFADGPAGRRGFCNVEKRFVDHGLKTTAAFNSKGREGIESCWVRIASLHDREKA